MRIRKKAWARPELAVCSYFVEKPQDIKGHWKEEFPGGNPVHLDLGCGKGVFLAEIAYNQLDVNFIGIDISTDILGVARRNIDETFGGESPQNLKFFKYNIEKLSEVFSPADGIGRIYINFCNPWPKSRGHKKRLTHTRQLEEYLKFLGSGAEIFFKTDDDDLYLATERYLISGGFEITEKTVDLHKADWQENVLTEHELMFSSQGIKIKAIKAIVKGGGTTVEI